MWMTEAMARIRSLSRDDRGTTLVELSVAGLLAGIVLTIMAFFLVSSMKTGAFTQGQSETINNVRNAVQRIEKEVRGADSLVWAPNEDCSAYAAGTCVTVGAQNVDTGFRTVRYTHSGTELRRELYDTDTSTWGTAQTIIERVSNDLDGPDNTAGTSDDQPVFTCDTQVTLLRLTIDLYVEPTPVSNPNFHVQTSIRPRNFPSVAACS
jgi:type II secretory pathway component PulJ